MKSLTIEDMELSVRNKIWATQAHNEEALNRAYEVCGLLPLSEAMKADEFRPLRMSSSFSRQTSLVNISA